MKVSPKDRGLAPSIKISRFGKREKHYKCKGVPLLDCGRLINSAMIKRGSIPEYELKNGCHIRGRQGPRNLPNAYRTYS